MVPWADTKLTGHALNVELARPWDATRESADERTLLDPLMSILQKERFLAYCAGMPVTHTGDRPYLHSHVISFRNGREKDSWKTFMDYCERLHSFKAFMTTAHHKRKIWVAMLNTPVESWVFHKDYEADWHTWGALLANHDGGKCLLIFDADIDQHSDDEGYFWQKRQKRVFSKPQQDFINQCLSPNRRSYVWAGGRLAGLQRWGSGGDNIGDSIGDCIAQTAKWIRWNMEIEDGSLPHARDAQGELRGFRRVTRR